jgi:hypothetical protein
MCIPFPSSCISLKFDVHGENCIFWGFNNLYSSPNFRTITSRACNLQEGEEKYIQVCGGNARSYDPTRMNCAYVDEVKKSLC